MKKLILILSLIFCLVIAAPVLAFEKVDISGTGFDTDVIFRAKIVEFLEQLNFTELSITNTLGNARQIHWQFTATSIEGGEHLTGIQLRSNWGGTADSPTAGITGIEIKARSASDSITHTLGTAKAIIANVDVKKAKFTTAWGVESQFDLSSGGEITTGAAFRASLNNSGTFTNSYAYLVETANTALNWNYGFYCAAGQADVGMQLGGGTTGINITGTYTTAAINIGTSNTNITLDGMTQRLVEIHGDCTASFSSGTLGLFKAKETISGDADVTGTGGAIPIMSQIQIEGSDDTTLWSSTSVAACLGGWMGSDDASTISQTNGHLLAGWFTVGLGEHYTGTVSAFVAGMLISSETHASAVMNGFNYSAIRVMKNSGKLDWSTVLDIRDCEYLLRIESDGEIANSTAASPLGDIQSQASAGYIRIIIGAGNTVKYIALYDGN